MEELHIQNAIIRQAVGWFLAQRSEPLTAAQNAKFMRWLRESPQHVEEYLAIAGISALLPAASDALDVELEDLIREANTFDDSRSSVISLLPSRQECLPSVAHEKTVWHFWRSAAAILVVLGVAAWLLLGVWNGDSQRYVTARGERSIWKLPDGSVLELNSDSSAVERFSRGERRLELERGQMLLDVTHDSERPFRVTAGQADVVAVGTRFDVYRQSDAVVVTVIEGRVNVMYRQMTAKSDTGRSSPVKVLSLARGEQVSVGRLAKPKSVQIDVEAATAWVQGQIIFDRQPLAEVVKELNRYGRVPIEIDDAKISALRISGVLDAYDTESFIRFVERLDDVVVESGPDVVRIKRRQGHSAASVTTSIAPLFPPRYHHAAEY